MWLKILHFEMHFVVVLKKTNYERQHVQKPVMNTRGGGGGGGGGGNWALFPFKKKKCLRPLMCEINTKAYTLVHVPACVAGSGGSYSLRRSRVSL